MPQLLSRRRDKQLMRIAGNDRPVQQRIQRAITGCAAYQLDTGTRDRLSVGDDSQHLQSRPGQRHRPRFIQVPLDGRSRFGRR